MGMKIGSAFIQLSLKGQDKILSGFKKLGGAIGAVAKRVKQLAIVFGGLLVAGAVFSLKKAAEAQEILSKFEAVFKDQADAAALFAKNLGGSVGRSVVELKEFLASLQDIFVPMGFAREEARKLSEQLLRLAIDVASFNNKTDADVIRDFQSALVGSTETVRKYGIVITQARLEQELLEGGFKGTIKEATEQQKVIARMRIILKGTSDAQGDAAKTAGSFSNQVKALKGEIRDAAVEIGNQLIPMATRLVKHIRANIPAIKAAGIAIGGWVVAFIRGFDQMITKARVFWLEFKAAALDSIDSVIQQVQFFFDKLTDSLAQVFLGDLQNAADAFSKKFEFVSSDDVKALRKEIEAINKEFSKRETARNRVAGEAEGGQRLPEIPGGGGGGRKPKTKAIGGAITDAAQIAKSIQARIAPSSIEQKQLEAQLNLVKETKKRKNDLFALQGFLEQIEENTRNNRGAGSRFARG